ncbi:hypothetical protein HF072_07300 [Bacillus sp. RO3]|nr:hypothetical protein [Bacillus sp. RO3]
MGNHLLNAQKSIAKEIKKRSHHIQSEFEKGSKHGLMIASGIIAEQVMKEGMKVESD